jgi:hypothetical protein
LVKKDPQRLQRYVDLFHRTSCCTCSAADMVSVTRFI